MPGVRNDARGDGAVLVGENKTHGVAGGSEDEPAKVGDELTLVGASSSVCD